MTVNLQTLERLNELASKQPGVVVVDTKLFGLALHATCDFAPGQVVVDEEAAFIVHNNNIRVAVVEASQKPHSSEILDLFFSLTEEQLPNYPNVAKLVKLFPATMLVDRKFLIQFVSAFSLNAHSIKGDDAGLFVIGSKAPHSCCPNTIIRVEQKAGNMQLVAIKPIAKGEMVTFAYIAGAKLAWPHRFRQQKLLNDRGFICLCARCVESDDMRMFRCKNTSCKGQIVHMFKENVFRCNACETTFGKNAMPLKMEKTMEDKVMEFEMTNPAFVMPNHVMPLWKKCNDLLGPDHWTVFFLERMLLEMIMCGALKRDSNSIQLGQHAIQWLNNYFFPINPVSVSSIMHLMVTGKVVDFKKKDNKAILARVFPFFEILWGKNDPDVANWAKIIKK